VTKACRGQNPRPDEPRLGPGNPDGGTDVQTRGEEPRWASPYEPLRVSRTRGHGGSHKTWLKRLCRGPSHGFVLREPTPRRGRAGYASVGKDEQALRDPGPLRLPRSGGTSQRKSGPCTGREVRAIGLTVALGIGRVHRNRLETREKLWAAGILGTRARETRLSFEPVAAFVCRDWNAGLWRLVRCGRNPPRGCNGAATGPARGALT